MQCLKHTYIYLYITHTRLKFDKENYGVAQTSHKFFLKTAAKQIKVNMHFAHEIKFKLSRFYS